MESDSNSQTVDPPSLTIFKPREDMKGAALRLTLIPNGERRYMPGHIRLLLAPQLVIQGDPDPSNKVFPRFDWTNANFVPLDFRAISLILQVLRGETESIFDGKGFMITGSKSRYSLFLRHVLNTFYGYELEVMNTPITKDENGQIANGESRYSSFPIEPHEALGLADLLSSALFYVSFGIPKPQMPMPV